jgi:hypothetical protein
LLIPVFFRLAGRFSNLLIIQLPRTKPIGLLTLPGLLLTPVSFFVKLTQSSSAAATVVYPAFVQAEPSDTQVGNSGGGQIDSSWSDSHWRGHGGRAMMSQRSAVSGGCLYWRVAAGGWRER